MGAPKSNGCPGRGFRLPSDIDLAQARWPLDDAVHRERVHQFVGEKHARDRVSRYFVQARRPVDTHTGTHEFAQAQLLYFEHGWAPFHQEVSKAGKDLRVVPTIRV